MIAVVLGMRGDKFSPLAWVTRIIFWVTITSESFFRPATVHMVHLRAAESSIEAVTP